MKKKLLFVGLLSVMGLLSMVGCSKEKTCRCAVLQSEKVRVIKISSGTCEDIRTFTYHDEHDNLKVEKLLCTDYEFTIDSIYN